MFKYGNRSMRKLIGVNPLLALVAMRAIGNSRYDFGVFEGVRTIKKQRKYVALGVSWTMKSKHITGNAVDLVPYIDGKYQWDSNEAKVVFKEIRRVMLLEASKLGCGLVCGSDWKSKDLPHFQLSNIDIGTYNYLKFTKNKR